MRCVRCPVRGRFVEETDDGEKTPEEEAREYVEKERARVLAAGSVYDAELVREFIVALSRRVGWSGRVTEQVVTKMRAVGLTKMEQVSLAFRFAADSLGDAFDEDHGIDRAAEAKAAEEAKQAKAAAAAKAAADGNGDGGDGEGDGAAKGDGDSKEGAEAKTTGGDSAAPAAVATAAASGAKPGAVGDKRPPISPVKRVRIVTDADTARAEAGAQDSKSASGTASPKSSLKATSGGANGDGDESKGDAEASTPSAPPGPKPLLVNKLMRGKGFRPFSARTVAVAVAMMTDKDGKYFFVSPVLRSPVSRKPVVKPRVSLPPCTRCRVVLVGVRAVIDARMSV